MNALDCFGIHEQDIKRTQDSCTDTIFTVAKVLETTNVSDDSLEELKDNFEKTIADFFNNAQRTQIKESEKIFLLDEIGIYLQASMICKTAEVLNHIPIIDKIRLAQFGTTSAFCDSIYDIENVAAEVLTNPELLFQGIKNISEEDFKYYFSNACIFELADMFRYEIEGDKNTGEILSNFETAIKESLENNDIEISDIAQAILSLNNDNACYDKVRNAVDDTFKELCKKDEILFE